MSPPHYDLVEARHGRFLVNPRDEYVGRSIIAYGQWGEDEVLLFESLLRPGDVVVEVGANIGSHTVPLAKAVGPAGHVHAFEPQRLIHQLLCANLALNDCFNVHAHRMAVGDASGSVEICHVPPYHHTNYGGLSVGQVLGADTTLEYVPIIDLDSLGLQRLDLLKIDAEGYDARVLAGAKASIAMTRPAIFTEIGRETFSAIVELLVHLDYDCYWYCTRLFDEENHFNRLENVWDYRGRLVCSVDMLALPRERGWTVSGLPPVSGMVDIGRLPLVTRGGFSVQRPT